MKNVLIINNNAINFSKTETLSKRNIHYHPYPISILIVKILYCIKLYIYSIVLSAAYPQPCTLNLDYPEKIPQMLMCTTFYQLP